MRKLKVQNIGLTFLIGQSEQAPNKNDEYKKYIKISITRLKRFIYQSTFYVEFEYVI